MSISLPQAATYAVQRMENNASRVERSSCCPSFVKRSLTIIDTWADAHLSENVAYVVKRIARAAPLIFAICSLHLGAPAFFFYLPIVVLLEKTKILPLGYSALIRDGIGFSLLLIASRCHSIFLLQVADGTLAAIACSHMIPAQVVEKAAFAIIALFFSFGLLALPSQEATEEEFERI
jgi:hypothetical protein